MAKKTEFLETRADGVNLFYTYSDSGKMLVRNDGEMFVDAVDVENSGYTYEESDVDANGTAEATEQDLLDALAELGVADDEESNA